MTNPSTIELLALICFSAALINALSATWIKGLSAHFVHYFSEIEVIFGFWSLVYLTLLLISTGPGNTVMWIEGRHFSEALFITAIMLIASTQPILNLARQGINQFANWLPFSSIVARYFSILMIGPLFGSFITEPAAMTVCALLLHLEVLPKNASQKLLYSTLAFLFVNISIGGLLTHFAAPPILMVAERWEWTTPFMFINFGWKALVAVAINAVTVSFINSRELNSCSAQQNSTEKTFNIPLSVYAINLIFLSLIILLSRHSALLIAAFTLFISYTYFTRKHQGNIRPKNALLVGVFLAGLIILTAEQGFWLKPLLISLKDFTLYIGAIALTAITDNAALTSLAAQVGDLTEPAKYAVVAGAVVGGGLTLIANAPNPAGFSILKSRFNGVLKPGTLFIWALIPTFVAGGILWIHT